VSETYSIPVSNGILTPTHRRQMGPAIWVFLWMIDRTTKEIPGQDGSLEGMVLGGQQIRASVVAKDLDLSTRAVHEHIELLCRYKYVRRIDGGVGLPAGYAVQNSKKWKKNQQPTTVIHEVDNLAEKRGPSRKSADLPRGFGAGVRGKARYPRGFPLPIRKTVQDNTEQTTAGAVDGVGTKATKTKKRVRKVATDEIDKVYQAYPLKKAPARARAAIAKAFERLVARGESDPTSFLIDRIAALKAIRDRDNAAGRFVPHLSYPEGWFNGECYDEPDLKPLKNCVLPSGKLGTEADLAQTGWTVMRGEA
jgi:hypothetical protein